LKPIEQHGFVDAPLIEHRRFNGHNCKRELQRTDKNKLVHTWIPKRRRVQRVRSDMRANIDSYFHNMCEDWASTQINEQQ
jgi:hypothetical protein